MTNIAMERSIIFHRYGKPSINGPFPMAMLCSHNQRVAYLRLLFWGPFGVHISWTTPDQNSPSPPWNWPVAVEPPATPSAHVMPWTVVAGIMPWNSWESQLLTLKFSGFCKTKKSKMDIWYTWTKFVVFFWCIYYLSHLRSHGFCAKKRKVGRPAPSKSWRTEK